MTPHDLRPGHIGEHITIADADGNIIASGRLEAYKIHAEMDTMNFLRAPVRAIERVEVDLEYVTALIPPGSTITLST